jgi:cytochrome oxidase Cu insertion factor (SCO1/SenC/PrrC family)
MNTPGARPPSRRPFPVLKNWLLAGTLLLSACQSGGNEVSLKSLTAPLATPTPQPTLDPQVTDLERVKEGTLAPDFTLEDRDGTLYRLSDYRGKKNVVLVFYRGYF